MKTSEQLISIIEFILNSDHDGPWDREKDMGVVLPHLIEDACKVREAVRQKDEIKIRSGLGALLFQVIYLFHLAEEKGLFTNSGVLEEISRKLTAQTPYPDTDRPSVTADDNRVKAGLLDNIPVNLPALNRAQRLQEQAAGVGFDWQDIEPVWEKLEEELQEIKSALSGNAPFPKIMEETGDLIFVCVNLCRHLSVDAESALHQTNDKFRDRFNYIEDRIKHDGKSLEEVSLEVMDRLWDEAKRGRQEY